LAYFILEVNMRVYEHEINDNLREAVEASTSIAFTCDIINNKPETCPSCNSKIVCEDDTNQCSIATTEIAEAAEKQKQDDLYYLNSVLVSAGWNKNDDVFSTQALWAARDTPVDKQFNLMHDESDIIGHITDAMVMDQDGKILKDISKEGLPEKFDIVTSAVIYKTWSDIEMRMKINDITEEIDEGKWSVSMECVFTDFDYAVVTPQGEDKVLARDDQSSFLTKHLRAYGGTGEYEGYKLGRLLKGFFFSGKGLVEKPANPRSIIFSNDVNPFNASGSVNFTNFLTLRESTMTKALNEIEQVEASAKAEVDEMTQSVEVANEADKPEEQVEASPQEAEAAPELEAKVRELEDAMKKMAEENEAMKKFMAEKDDEEEETEAPQKPGHDGDDEEEAMEEEEAEEEEAEEMQEAGDDDKKELETALKQKEDELEAMKEEMARINRKASLSSAGVDEVTAEALIQKFSGASDEMFATVVELAKAKAPVEAPAPEANDCFEEEQENEANASDLDEVEDVVEPSLAEAGEEKQEVAMASAVEWLRDSVLNLTKNIKK